MTQNEIMTQMQKGIWVTCHVFAGMPSIPDELLEEILQEAWLRYLENDPDSDERRDPFLAGKRAAAAFLRRERGQYKSLSLEPSISVAAHDEEDRELCLDIVATLEDIFLQQRRKRGDRGAAAAKRDAKILSLLVAGYSDDGIALELSLSPTSVKRYRNQIRRRLEAIANTEMDYVPAWSISKNDVDTGDAV